MDLVFMNDPGHDPEDNLLWVHSAMRCQGEICCIHNPSQHHMVTWPQAWRDDVGVVGRVCPHGMWHPDPDDLKVRAGWTGDHAHTCDGCCSLAIYCGCSPPKLATKQPCEGCGAWLLTFPPSDAQAYPEPTPYTALGVGPGDHLVLAFATLTPEQHAAVMRQIPEPLHDRIVLVVGADHIAVIRGEHE